MRLVIDTNVAVSGLLWSGNPNAVLKTVRDKQNELLVSDDVIQELQKVILYKKSTIRIKQLGTTTQGVMAYYQNLSTFIPIIKKANVQAVDPDDIMFLHLALNGSADLIVSGDPHLLNLKTFNNISIVKPSEAVKIFSIF